MRCQIVYLRSTYEGMLEFSLGLGLTYQHTLRRARRATFLSQRGDIWLPKPKLFLFVASLSQRIDLFIIFILLIVAPGTLYSSAFHVRAVAFRRSLSLNQYIGKHIAQSAANQPGLV